MRERAVRERIMRNSYSTRALFGARRSADAGKHAHPDEVEAVAKAIARTGRPILLSLSPGGKVDPEAIDFFKMGNMLRVTPDVWDEQKYIDLCFDAWRKWEGKEQPGFWIDMDMIPFGQLQLMSPPINRQHLGE